MHTGKAYLGLAVALCIYGKFNVRGGNFLVLRGQTLFHAERYRLQYKRLRSGGLEQLNYKGHQWLVSVN